MRLFGFFSPFVWEDCGLRINLSGPMSLWSSQHQPWSHILHTWVIFLLRSSMARSFLKPRWQRSFPTFLKGEDEYVLQGLFPSLWGCVRQESLRDNTQGTWLLVAQSQWLHPSLALQSFNYTPTSVMVLGSSSSSVRIILPENSSPFTLLQEPN